MESTFQPTNHRWMYIIFIWASFSTKVLPGHAKEIGTWCEALASGPSATVTCHFTQDLNMSKLDFTLMHQKPTSFHNKPVLSCNWYTHDASIACNAATDYAFDKKVSNQFEVEIPTVRGQDHDGHYTCRVISHKDTESFEPCMLNITAVPDAPAELRIQNITLESVTVCWKPPPDKDQQVAYRVRYKPSTSRNKYTTVDFFRPSDACVFIAGMNQTETSDNNSLFIVLGVALLALIVGATIAYKGIRSRRKPENPQEFQISLEDYTSDAEPGAITANPKSARSSLYPDLTTISVGEKGKEEENEAMRHGFHRERAGLRDNDAKTERRLLI